MSLGQPLIDQSHLADSVATVARRWTRSLGFFIAWQRGPRRFSLQKHRKIGCSKCAHDRMSPSGFSLIELLIAIVLLSVLFGLALPGVVGWEKRNSGAAAIHKTRHSLLAARQQAIDEGKPVRWVLSENNATITVLFQPNGCASDARIPVTSDNSIVGTVTVIGATGSIRVDRVDR